MDENFRKHLDNMLRRSVQLDYDHGEVATEVNPRKEQLNLKDKEPD